MKKINSINKVFCLCIKSNCKNKYCTCISKGAKCNKSCSCKNCLNIDN